MYIKDLPEDIKKIAIQRVIEYRKRSKSKDFAIPIEEATISNGFTWLKTIEGQEDGHIWLHVEDGNLEPFYKFHNIKTNENKLLNINFY